MSYFNQQLQAVDAILHRVWVYRDPQRVRKDVFDLLKNTPSLQPRVASLGNNTGQLLYLAGTIPIFYRGNQYNIPVQIWIIEQYPWRPPICYVKPTPDMTIKKRHKHCDSNGMCYLPYLSNWNYNTCSLSGLVHTMSKIFGEDPPVRANPNPNKQPTHPPPSYPSSNKSTGQQVGSYPPNQPPPFPASNQSPYPGSTPDKSPIPPMEPLLSKSQTTSSSSSSFENQSEVARRNALPALNSKIQQKLRQLYSESSDLDEIMNKNSELERKNQSLLQEKARLEQEKEQTTFTVEDLSKKFEDISTWIEENKENDSIDIDAATDSKEPLTKQLLHLVTEDATIEDTLYYLEKALGRGSITIDVFLKTVRNLTADQFRHRATIRKIHEKQRGISR